MKTANPKPPWRVGRRVKVRWPVKEPDGLVFTAGEIVAAGERIILDLETADGRRVGLCRDFARDQLLLESSHDEG